MTKFKELGELTVFLTQLMSSIDAKLSDKKLSLTESVSLTLEILPNVAQAFIGIKNIPAELTAANTQDLVTLVAEISTRLSLRNERTEQIVIKALNIAVYTTDLFLTIQKKPQLVKGFGTIGELVQETPIKIGDFEDIVL